VELESETTVAVASPAPMSRATEMRLQVKVLIDSDNLTEAETIVRRELLQERSLEVLLVAADVLSRRFKVNDATDLLDEALKLAPQNYMAHIRQGEHLARIGLFPQALEAIGRARRYLPAHEVAALVYCQELERVFRERSKGGFVRNTKLRRLSMPRPFRRESPDLTPENA